MTDQKRAKKEGKRGKKPKSDESNSDSTVSFDIVDNTLFSYDSDFDLAANFEFFKKSYNSIITKNFY